MGMRAAATPCITRGQQDQRLAQKNEFRTFEPPPLARIPCKHRLDEKRRDEKKPRELAGQSHGWGESQNLLVSHRRIDPAHVLILSIERDHPAQRLAVQHNDRRGRDPMRQI